MSDGAWPRHGALDDALLMHALLDDAGEVIYFKDLESRFLRVSRGCALLHRRTAEQMVGLTDFDLFDAEHARKARVVELRIIETGRPMLDNVERESWHDRPDSWVSSSKFPLRDQTGAIIGTFGISRDITPRVAAELEVRRVEAQLRSVLAGSSDEIVGYDADLRLRYLNPAAERALGVALAEVQGRSDAEAGMRPELLEQWEPALRRTLETGEPGELEFERPTPGGCSTWWHTTFSPDLALDGTPIGVLASTRDITRLKAAEAALAHQATHDPLTGLANRWLVLDRLHAALARASRTPGHLALFFVDLDHFKAVNDTFGHKVGDRVLIEVARRLQRVARAEDTVGRLAGDEFVVICERVPSEACVADIARRIVDAASQPVEVAGAFPRVSASVGVALADDAAVGASNLLNRADGAMYDVKRGGRNGFRIATA
jgi:diguanylate cyclase (GGDEF)-like protein/PAS domain S-box-containing protein